MWLPVSRTFPAKPVMRLIVAVTLLCLLMGTVVHTFDPRRADTASAAAPRQAGVQTLVVPYVSPSLAIRAAKESAAFVKRAGRYVVVKDFTATIDPGAAKALSTDDLLAVQQAVATYNRLPGKIRRYRITYDLCQHIDCSGLQPRFPTVAPQLDNTDTPTAPSATSTSTATPAATATPAPACVAVLTTDWWGWNLQLSHGCIEILESIGSAVGAIAGFVGAVVAIHAAYAGAIIAAIAAAIAINFAVLQSDDAACGDRGANITGGLWVTAFPRSIC